MILYSAFFGFISMLFFEADTLFERLFILVGVPAGARTLLIQAAIGGLCILIFLRYARSQRVWPDLGKLCLIWLVWLVYLFLRADFDDPYAERKIMRIFAIQFLSLVFIMLAYHASPQRFERYFFPVVVTLSALLLLFFFAAPSLFYRVDTGRLTLENVSPVWLARTYAIAAMWLIIRPKPPVWLKLLALVVFTVGILYTGSRGPLLSLYVTLVGYLIVRLYRRPNFAMNAVLVGGASLLVLALSVPVVQGPLNDYLTRGKSKPVLEQSGRGRLWTWALDDAASAPLIGVGLGQYNKAPKGGVGGISRTRFGDKAFERMYPHNIVLEVLAELGLVGLVIFAVLLRPGRWMLRSDNPFVVLFWLSFLFAMTSGDIPANSGLFLFGLVAWLHHHRYEGPDAGIRAT